MTYSELNFLLVGNSVVQIPPVKLLTLINPKGKMKLNEELYEFEEEIDLHKKKLVTLFEGLMGRYGTKKLDESGNPIKKQERFLYETEDVIENGQATKRVKMEDREGYNRDLDELFALEFTFKAKFTKDLLDGVEQIGRNEYRWLRELDLLK
jgi:hypothetical protein